MKEAAWEAVRSTCVIDGISDYLVQCNWYRNGKSMKGKVILCCFDR